MVLVWMACLTTDLQLHERSFHHRANCIYFFKYFLCFEHCVCCSSVSFRGLQLTGGAVHLPKMFPLKSLPRLRDGSPSLDHSAERTVFQPLLPAASWTKKKKKKKTEIARADPTGHVNLSRLQHRNNRLYLQVALKTVCAHSFTCLRNIVCINMLTRSGTNY